MRKHIWDFMRRGTVACGLGPLVLAIFYWIMYHQGIVHTLSVEEVCLGIFSLTALAFIAGGMNFIYQIEQLPLMVAILIHGCVLYMAYLLTYLLNNWLERAAFPILVFTGIFLFGYLVIWAVIYFIIHRNTKKINKILKQKQHHFQE